MASKNIKGITIEFDGDTTKLGSALQKINKEAKSVDKDLQSVNKSLRFNPKNTELLAQKQTLLKDKISQTEKQLSAFKKAQQQLDDEGIDKTSQQYMELRRNIIETESKLKHFNAELEKTRNAKFEQVGAQFKAVGDKMQSVGKSLTTHVTAPIAAVGGIAMKSFNEVTEGMNIVAQKTGATGKALEELQGQARELAKTLPVTFEDAGTAIGEVKTRFNLAGDVLENVTGQFLKFAKVNGTDVNQSIDQAQKTLAAFGQSATEAPALLDTMTRAGQMTGVSMETLQSGLVQNAAAFQQMGLSMDQSVAFMAQRETSGANAETVMQGMRKALKNAAKEGKPLNTALSDLQNTIANGKGDMDGLNAAYDLFGKSGDQIYNAVKNGSLDFQELAASAYDSKNALDSVYNETLTPAEKFKMTMNTLKDTGYQLGNNLMTILAPAIQKVSEVISKVSEWWSNLSEKQQDMIVKIALVVAAIGPLIMVIGKIVSGIGAIVSILPLLAGPAGIAIAAIAAIIAIGVALYKNWDKIKKKAGDIKDGIVEKFTALKNKVKDIFEGIKYAITHPIETAKKIIKSIVDKIKGFFANFKIKLPKIKLPHFHIEPEGWKISDLLHGDIPHLGIDWYAKGGIFDSPSVIGVGEAGPEAVLPIEKLNEMMTSMADSIVNGILVGQQMQATTGDITIPIYLYPSGAKMGEEVVKSYDIYKRQLG